MLAGIPDASGKTVGLAGLGLARDKAGRVVEHLLKKVDEICAHTVGEFRRQRGGVVDVIIMQLQTWTDYEPYTKTVEGFFVDDYVVDYKEVLRWEWPLERVELFDESTRANANITIKDRTEGCFGALNDFNGELRDVNQEFENAAVSSLGDPGRFAEYSSRQTVMLERDFFLFIRSRDWYFHGGMNCGGLYALQNILFAGKYEDRPGRDNIQGLVDWLLPLSGLAEMIEDHGNLTSQIRDSAMECYDSMEQDLGRTMAAIQELEATLNRALSLLSGPVG